MLCIHAQMLHRKKSWRSHSGKKGEPFFWSECHFSWVLVCPKKASEQRSWICFWMILLMEEIPNNHHGCIKPGKKMGSLPYQLVQDFVHQPYFTDLIPWDENHHFSPPSQEKPKGFIQVLQACETDSTPFEGPKKTCKTKWVTMFFEFLDVVWKEICMFNLHDIRWFSSVWVALKIVYSPQN